MIEIENIPGRVQAYMDQLETIQQQIETDFDTVNVERASATIKDAIAYVKHARSVIDCLDDVTSETNSKISKLNTVSLRTFNLMRKRSMENIFDSSRPAVI